MKALKIWFPLVALIVFGCRKTEVKPVDILPEDLCAFCKMAISDKMFAGEIVKEDGEAVKFDDLGCLRAYARKEGGPKGMHLFFRSMEKDEWIKAEQAVLVKTPLIKTPMGSGLIAFEEKKNADAFTKQHGGQLVAFDEYLKGKSFHE